MTHVATLEGLITAAFVEFAGELRVCLPGRIESYDPDTHLASVQPLIKRKFYRRKTSGLLPIINRVPVEHPRTGKALIRLPVARGDIVTLVFADRSLEAWLQGKGAASEALDTRQHHLSDAYAFLGGYPEKNKITADNPDALEIHVEPGTKVTVGNGTDELLQIAYDAFNELKQLVQQVSQTMTDVQAITVTAPGGGGVTSTPINAGSFATIKTAVDAIETDVDTAIAQLENIKV